MLLGVCRRRSTGRGTDESSMSSSSASPSAYQAADSPPELPFFEPVAGSASCADCAARAAAWARVARLPPAMPMPSAVTPPGMRFGSSADGTVGGGGSPSGSIPGSVPTAPDLLRAELGADAMSPAPRAPSLAIAWVTDVGGIVSGRHATSSAMMWPLSEPWRSASIKRYTVMKRWSGRFDSMRMTARLNQAGTSARRAAGSTGSASTWRVSTSNTLPPTNGGSPTTIS